MSYRITVTRRQDTTPPFEKPNEGVVCLFLRFCNPQAASANRPLAGTLTRQQRDLLRMEADLLAVADELAVDVARHQHQVLLAQVPVADELDIETALPVAQDGDRAHVVVVLVVADAHHPAGQEHGVDFQRFAGHRAG